MRVPWRQTSYPMRWLPLPWRWRLWYCKRQYDIGSRLAERVCRGNRYGVHTPNYYANPALGGQCFCSRVRRRLDYIPF